MIPAYPVLTIWKTENSGDFVAAIFCKIGPISALSEKSAELTNDFKMELIFERIKNGGNVITPISGATAGWKTGIIPNKLFYWEVRKTKSRRAVKVRSTISSL